jgi:hypothetical protein
VDEEEEEEDAVLIVNTILHSGCITTGCMARGRRDHRKK